MSVAGRIKGLALEMMAKAVLTCAPCSSVPGGGLVPGSYIEGVNDTTHPLGVPKIVSS